MQPVLRAMEGTLAHQGFRVPSGRLQIPRVRVLMMQKDEGDMFLRWLAHYAGLFGFENLLIFDNGSSDEQTLRLLHEAEERGSRVYHHLTGLQDWRHKGMHMLNMIRSLDDLEDYDFAIPLDCDEFLAVFTDEGLSTDHGAIRQELTRLCNRRCALRLDMSLFNHPGQDGWFIPNFAFHKGFLPARSIESIDHGQHEPASRLEAGYETTRLTYLHMHNAPYDEAVSRAKHKLAGLVDVEDRDALVRYLEQGGNRGVHLVITLLTSREEYQAKFERDLQLFVPGPLGGLNFLRDEGQTTPWHAGRYLSANPDVLSYGLTPLHHYLRYGRAEGRVLG